MKKLFLPVCFLLTIFCHAQNVGIGVVSPTEKLEIAGSIKLNSSLKGVILNAADMPLITRGFDPFTSGEYTGIGRWGLFMEPSQITIGLPNIAGKGFQVAAYDPNSTIARSLLTVDYLGNMNVFNKITRTAKTGNSNLVPVCYGNVNADGTIASGTGNFTIINDFTGYYEIRITGYSLVAELVILVSPFGGGGTLQSVKARDFFNAFMVHTYNGSGSFVAAGFSFIIYDPQ